FGLRRGVVHGPLFLRRRRGLQAEHGDQVNVRGERRDGERANVERLDVRDEARLRVRRARALQDRGRTVAQGDDDEAIGGGERGHDHVEAAELIEVGDGDGFDDCFGHWGSSPRKNDGYAVSGYTSGTMRNTDTRRAHAVGSTPYRTRSRIFFNL